MKTIKLTLLLILIFSLSQFAQKGRWQDEEAREKVEQLEKIKLIESLELNEETTLRFFARRTEHSKQQEDIQKKILKNIDDLELIFKSGRVVTVDEIKKSISEINSLQLQFDKNRVDFINSLSDIMSYEQIAKLIIFEKRFKNELRKLIIQERRPPFNPD